MPGYSVPTLFLSECVLVYMAVKDSSQLIAWAASRWERAAFVIYEQIRPHDAFGRVMMQNLKVNTGPSCLALMPLQPLIYGAQQ